MSDLPEDAQPKRGLPRGVMLLLGALAGDAVIALLYGGAWTLIQTNSELGFLGVPSFFLMPMCGGLLAALICRRLSLTVIDDLWVSLVMLIVALGISVVLFKEGMICIIIVCPVFYLSLFAGLEIGRLLFKKQPPRLKLALVPLVALATLVEPSLRQEQTRVVRDSMVIHASPEKVWPLITSFPAIPTAPRFWLFRIGLPYPESTTRSGDFPGAERRCNFSHQAIFEERVTHIVPAENLTFQITDIPKDPELLGHLTPLAGQFLLHRNSDGSTTLVGSTWYRLHVRPAWYFDWWTHHIFQAVHRRVMEDVKRRAEGAG